MNQAIPYEIKLVMKSMTGYTQKNIIETEYILEQQQ